MIENLLDEALIGAMARGEGHMRWKDLEHARMVVEVGLGQPVGYTAHEERLIATHEAGHAAVAWLVAPQRRLEILTIVKRASALGLLAHGDREDVYTRSRSELAAMVQIAFGGQVAEELFFGDVSTGPAGDLAFATSTAAQMVGSSGMGDTLVSLVRPAAGRSAAGWSSQVLGDRSAREQVEALLHQQKAVVRGLLAPEPAPRRGPPRRPARAARAHRARDHRRAGGGRGGGSLAAGRGAEPAGGRGRRGGRACRDGRGRRGRPRGRPARRRPAAGRPGSLPEARGPRRHPDPLTGGTAGPAT